MKINLTATPTPNNVSTNATLVTNELGKKFWIPNNDTYFLPLMSKGPYQGKNVERLRELCPKPRHVVDIGVNLAQNIVQYAEFSPRVTGFEPTDFNYQCAHATILENQNLYPDADINFYKCGLGNKKATMYIKTHISNVGTNFIVAEASKNTELVPVETLDSFNLTDVDIIKIDVEGFELYVVEGGEQTIMKYRPFIQTEIREGHCERAGTTPQALCDWFADRDYIRTVKVNEKVRSLFNYTGKDKYVPIFDRTYYNVASGDSFWVPKEKLTMAELSPAEALFE